jgi:hypothetical protein
MLRALDLLGTLHAEWYGASSSTMSSTPNGAVSPYFFTPSRARRPFDPSSLDTDTSEDEDEDEETPPRLFSYSVMPSYADGAGRRRSSRLSLSINSHRPVEPSTPISQGRRKKRREGDIDTEAKKELNEAGAVGTGSAAPPTPESLPRRKPKSPRTELVVEIPIRPPSTPTRGKRNQVETSTTQVVAPNERGLAEPVGKIHLIQGRSDILSLSAFASVRR